MKYAKFLQALMICTLGSLGFAQASVKSTGTFIAWNALPASQSMSVGGSYEYHYQVINNNFSPSLPLTVSVSHASGGSTATISGNTCSNLAIGHTCSFTINVLPTSADVASGIHDTVSVSYNGRGSPLTSALTGAVSNLPSATLTGPSVTQVTSQVSGTRQQILYHFTNTGTVNITSVAVSGISSSAEGVMNGCSDATLVPHAICAIAVLVRPQAASINTTIPSATLSVNYGGSAVLTKNIAAISVTSPMLAVATERGHIFKLLSSQLGTGTWTLANSPELNSTFIPIIGSATYNTDGEEINDSLLAAGARNTITTNDPLISYSNAGGTSWTSLPSSALPETSNFKIFSMTIDPGNYIMTAGCPSTTGSSCSGSRAFWYAGTAESELTHWRPVSGFTTSNNKTPYAFAYGNGYYVAASSDGSSTIDIDYGTYPGATWETTSVDVGENFNVTGLAYYNHQWLMTLANGSSTGGIFYSSVPSNTTPPTTWTAATGAFTSMHVSGVTYDAAISKFVAIAYDNSNDAYVFTSSDGVTWSSGTLLGNNLAVTSINYSRSTGVVVIAGAVATGLYTGNGVVLYNTGSDLTTGWQTMSNVTTGDAITAIASSTQT
jgi:hypothetical protein